MARDDAVAAARKLARPERILAGISSGAALATATEVASRPDLEDGLTAVMLAHTGEWYLSTDLFE